MNVHLLRENNYRSGLVKPANAESMPSKKQALSSPIGPMTPTATGRCQLGMSDRNLCILFVLWFIFTSTNAWSLLGVDSWIRPITDASSIFSIIMMVISLLIFVVVLINFVKICWSRSGQDFLGTFGRVLLWFFVAPFYIAQYMIYGTPLCGNQQM